MPHVAISVMFFPAFNANKDEISTFVGLCTVEQAETAMCARMCWEVSIPAGAVVNEPQSTQTVALSHPAAKKVPAGE